MKVSVCVPRVPIGAMLVQKSADVINKQTKTTKINPIFTFGRVVIQSLYYKGLLSEQ